MRIHALLGSAAGLAIVCAALGAAVPNAVRNPGFELDEDGNGIPDAWAPRNHGEATRVARGNGTEDSCVELAGTDPEKLPLWIQTELPLEGGKRYVVAYDARADAGLQFRAYVEWWKKDGTFGSSSLRWAGWQTAGGAWERKLFVFPYPEDAKPPYLVLQLKGAGRIRFDSVLVTEPLTEPLRDGNVFNNSFEAWPAMWQLDAGASIASEGASDGTRCLKLESQAEGEDPAATFSGIPTEVGKRYRLTFTAKAGGGSAETTGFQYFRVFTSWDRLVRDGKDFGSVSQRDGLKWQDCLASWQRRTLEFAAPEKPTSGMTVTCQVRGPGTVFIDDLELREIERSEVRVPDLELVLDRPWHRGSVYRTCPENAVAGKVVVRATGAKRVAVTIGRQGGAPIETQGVAVPITPGDVPFRLRLAGLTSGELLLTATALDGEGRKLGEATRPIRVLPPAPIEVCTRPDNVLLVNGKPFFPVGLWWTPPDERAVYELSRAGFNFARMGASADVLDTAESIGMMAMATIANDPPPAADAEARKAWEDAARARIEPLRAHPALLGYYIVDEPLWGGRPLQPLLDAYAFHRDLDPYHPIWLNAAPRGTVRDLAKYNRACDISGADIYPVPEGGGHSELDDKTVSSVGKYTDIMRASVDDRKPVWMTLQAFSWPHLGDRHADDAVYPSWEQSRFMAYDCIIHGATGLVYWGSHYIADPGFWDVLKRTASELRDMAAVFVASTVSPSPVRASHDDIVFLHKSWGGQHTIIAANEGTEAPEVTFAAPLGEARLHVLFEGRTVAVREGRFRDRFEANAVHVYSTQPSPPPPLHPPPAERNDLEGRSLVQITKEYLATENYRGSANWIWAPGRSGVRDSSCLLRRAFELEGRPRSAILTLTADDEYVCHLNGRAVARDEGWGTAERIDVTPLLRAGVNVLAVSARDAGVPPCAFLLDLAVEGEDGGELHVLSDAAWKAADEAADGWVEAGFDDSGWSAAEVVAPYGGGPWAKRLRAGPVTTPQEAAADKEAE